jgi:hypothetical protein
MKPLVQFFVIRALACTIWCVALVAVLAASASSAVPPMINYQGKLATPSGALIVADTVTMEFKIYNDSTGGTILWQETQNSVKVEQGIFNVLLGSANPIPDSVFNGSTRYLGVKVGADPEMTPRKPMVSVGYAFHSGTADTAKYSMPDADWVIDGDNIYHLNGNVGIGTGTPSEKLVIGDDFGSASETNMIVVNDASGTGNTAVSVGESATKRLAMKWDALEEFGEIGTTSGDLRLQNSISSNLILANGGGNVGIGTTSPGAKLDVAGSLQVRDYEGVYPRISAGSSGSSYGGVGYGFRFTGVSDQYTYSVDDFASQINFREGGFDFLTAPIGSYGNNVPFTSVMRIQQNGNVGIGTTSPLHKLHVEGASYLNGAVWVNGILALGDDQGAGITEFGSHGLGFRVGDVADKVVIDNIGNVGIGTTNPTAKLHINGQSRFDGQINIATNSGTEIVGDDGNILNIGSPYGVVLSTSTDSAGVGFLTNNNWRMVINGNGNVGIGTTNPRWSLDVHGTVSCYHNLAIYGDLVNYHWLSHDDISGGLFIDPIGSNPLILPNGNFGIGTTPNSAYRLDVDGDIRVANFYGNSGTLNGSLTVNGPGGSINSITGNTSGSYSGVAGINTGNGPGVYGATNSSAGNMGGVHGEAKVDGGVGVYGETWSPGIVGGSSVAVCGWAAATGPGVGGAALGVLGKVDSYQKPDPPYSSVPAGVFGWATATSGVNAGVYGKTDSPNGFGVYSKGKLEVDGPINTNGTITAGSGSSRLGVGTYNPSYRIHVGEGAYCNGTNWVNASSRKCKKDIRSLTGEEYQEILSKLGKTEVVRFRYTSQSDGKLHIGVIAEDAPEEMVDAERTGIPTGDAIGFLLAALKAQQEEIEALKAKLEKLESNR